ncbi:MAG: SHOCT domain-containing protein [Lentisphaeria bacterium]
MVKLDGLSSTMWVIDGPSLKIEHKGKSKVIQIGNIQSCEHQKPTKFKRGIITVKTGAAGGGLLNVGIGLASVGGEEIIVYMKENAEAAGKLCDYIQNYTSAGESVSSTADEIEKFKGLLDSGAITREEYEAKKKQLLNI